MKGLNVGVKEATVSRLYHHFFRSFEAAIDDQLLM
jgi:hypothetical protein